MEKISKGNKKKVVWIVVLVAALTIAAVCGMLIFRDLSGGKTPDPDKFLNTDTTEDTTDGGDIAVTEPQLPENPVDFDALRSENPDIYAWISVPGTNVEYPVLRSDADDLFYIDHAYDKSYSVSGAVFTQSMNKEDFSDPNTVIYGHYMIDGTFFGTLHNFRDETFFNENLYFYIYTPGHILTYEVFAAYEYDNRHILNSFDFSDRQVFADYLASCLDPKTVNRNIREGVALDPDDRIVTLSTCTTLGEATLRYLVQGVLLSDDQTR